MNLLPPSSGFLSPPPAKVSSLPFPATYPSTSSSPCTPPPRYRRWKERHFSQRFANFAYYNQTTIERFSSTQSLNTTTNTLGDKGAIVDTADFYVELCRMTKARAIADGSNMQPHLSMLTLAHALPSLPM